MPAINFRHAPPHLLSAVEEVLEKLNEGYYRVAEFIDDQVGGASMA